GIELRVAQALAHLPRELDEHLGSFAVDHGPPLEPAVADEPLHEAHPRRAPEPVALPVARRLRDLARVEPVEEGLLADLELVRDLEGREVLHSARAFSPTASPRVNDGTRGRIPRRSYPGIGTAEGRFIERGTAPSRVSRRDRFELEALPHLKRLYGSAYRMTHNPADAEDLVQETFLRAYRAFDRFATGTNIRAWLYTILHRVRTDALRRKGRAPETVELDGQALGVAPRQEGQAQAGLDLEGALAGLP